MINLLTKEFKKESSYKFLSTVIQAFHYRFIILSIDTWEEAFIIFGIKFAYKIVVYFITVKYSLEAKLFIRFIRKLFSSNLVQTIKTSDVISSANSKIDGL